jgi:UDP-N-acetylmuramate dehydrogenase
MDFKGNKVSIPFKDIKFTYRNALLPKDIIITSAILKGIPSSRQNIMETMRINEKKRAEAQPLKGKTCGSTFKNPPGAKAWELLVKSGANLLKKGGAYFSEKHANFILNDGTAKASDIEELGEEAVKLVKEKCGITLEWEVKRIGLRS